MDQHEEHYKQIFTGAHLRYNIYDIYDINNETEKNK